MRSGNQQRRSAKRNCWTNSVPYGYGGRIADMTVLPVRIIMSPTCSSRFFVGKNALSATARTNYSPSVGSQSTSFPSIDTTNERSSQDEAGADAATTLVRFAGLEELRC